jgi:hypothetical protein
MTVALITNSPQAIVATYPLVPNSLTLPGGTQVFGAVPGWTSPDGVYSLVNVAPFIVPGGQQISGPPTYSILGGVVTQTYPTQPIPAPQVAAALYNAALQAGLTITWSISTALNGTYALDTNTQVTLIGAYLASQNFTRPPIAWYLMNGTAVSFTTAQANHFGAAVWGYLNSLRAAQAVAAAGGNPTWPSNSVNVTG